LLFACSGKNDAPSGVLEREKMEDVMWDMMQADQYYREYLLRDSMGKDVQQMRYSLYEEVFKIHKISKAGFDKSYDYYSSRPKLIKDIFDSLSAKGNRRLQDFYKPAIEADSANNPKLKPRLDSSRAQ
jgi:hypothetical protein